MNPFAALQVSDDEDTFVQNGNSNQPKPPKKTHQERKQIKEAKIREAQSGTEALNQNLPERVKENQRNKKYQEAVLPKETPATGHYSDKKSGTGRSDRPRKEGGGRGNVGNLKDELHKDKYIAEGAEIAEETAEPVVEEPQGITLEEYYKNKGIEVDQLDAHKQAVKKGEVNAEWIKKEKLTVIQTKEDKRAVEEGQTKKGRRQYNDRVGLADNLNSELFGFNTQVAKPREEREEREPREQREPRENRGPREHREPREPRENRGPREHREPREPRENRGPRGENKEQRGPRDNKAPRDQKGGKPHQPHRHPVPRKPQEKVVLNQEEFPAL